MYGSGKVMVTIKIEPKSHGSSVCTFSIALARWERAAFLHHGGVHRHSIMQLSSIPLNYCHELVGFGGEHGKALEPGSVGRILPCVPEPGEGEQGSVLDGKAEGTAFRFFHS